MAVIAKAMTRAQRAVGARHPYLLREWPALGQRRHDRSSERFIPGKNFAVCVSPKRDAAEGVFAQCMTRYEFESLAGINSNLIQSPWTKAL
jgi:hypothetical protein